MKFYLGAHQPAWLTRVDFALFVSRRRLHARRSLPAARTGWALDSGGFTELSMHGAWTITPAAYIAEVRRYAQHIGRLEWAAPQDWMCEPIVINGGVVNGQRFAGTHLSVAEHQHRTVANYLELREMAPDLPFIPVLQGWTIADYLHCLDLYHHAGIDLTAAALVGLGSVCRRQSTGEIAAIAATLAGLGLSLHGFGVKTAGLRSYSAYLTSADSLSWSARGRRVRPCGHGRAMSEANCLHFATTWRGRVLNAGSPAQLDLLAELGGVA